MLVVTTIALAAALFLSMLALGELGRRLGARRHARDPREPSGGAGVLDGAIFALLGLLIAFTFSSAAQRFDERRHLIVEEANAIGTAWLRLDLLPGEAREPLRQLFRDYLDSRLTVYRHVADVDAVQRSLARNAELQAEIWRRSVEACVRPDGQRAIVVLLPALNEMFDITTTRMMATRIHQPEIILVLLIALGLICSLLAGYAMGQGGQHNWTYLVGFAVVITFTVYVIIDLEYPRRGFIRVDSTDVVLTDLRASMD